MKKIVAVLKDGGQPLKVVIPGHLLNRVSREAWSSLPDVVKVLSDQNFVALQSAVNGDYLYMNIDQVKYFTVKETD